MPRFTIVSALPDRGRRPRQSPTRAMRTNDARIQLLGMATRPALDGQLYLGQYAHERPPNAFVFDKKLSQTAHNTSPMQGAALFE